MKGPPVPFTRDKKNDWFIKQNFPQAPKGMETIRTSSGNQTLYYSFLVLLYRPACSPHNAPQREDPEVLLLSHYTVPC